MRIDEAMASVRRPGAIVASLLAFAGQLATQAGVPAVAANADTGLPAMETASPDVRYMADWIARTGDNAGMPYVIVDKVNATVFVMDARGHLDGSAPALLGMVRGDGSVPGIGDREMSAIRPDERTTPAGRFVASRGKDLHGQDILWIDYGTSIALHRVVKGTPAERRGQRLHSATSDDNRISYGCINVPVEFFDDVIRPAFADSSVMVYILPETSSVRDAYPAPVEDGKPDGSATRNSAAPGVASGR
jgi:hypothetical protein